MRIQGGTVNQTYDSISTMETNARVGQLDKNANSNLGDSRNVNTEQKKYTEEELIKAINEANKEFKWYDRKCEFSIHEKTKEIMIKVIDTTSNEVIREIPPKKILDMVAKMMEISGIIVDERA